MRTVTGRGPKRASREARRQSREARRQSRATPGLNRTQHPDLGNTLIIVHTDRHQSPTRKGTFHFLAKGQITQHWRDRGWNWGCGTVRTAAGNYLKKCIFLGMPGNARASVVDRSPLGREVVLFACQLHAAIVNFPALLSLIEWQGESLPPTLLLSPSYPQGACVCRCVCHPVA